MHSYAVMFLIMMVAGALSTMNLAVDSWTDIRWSLNDLYMILTMAGWMLVFMASLNQDWWIMGISLILVAASIWAIRVQLLISTDQFVLGMIPHHSMAVHMSRQLVNSTSPGPLKEFANQIIKNQENEIAFMKEWAARKAVSL
jgi:hypothetical protein